MNKSKRFHIRKPVPVALSIIALVVVSLIYPEIWVAVLFLLFVGVMIWGIYHAIKDEVKKEAADFVEALPIILGVLVLFSLIGFIQGWGDRLSQAKKGVFENIKLAKDETVEGQYWLYHMCNGRETYKYNVESNTKIPIGSDSMAQRMAVHEFPPSQKYREHLQVLTALLGGTSGGISYKNMRSAAKIGVPKRPLYIRAAAVLLGGISGYTIGHRFGSKLGTKCSSDLTHEVLESDENWTKIEEMLVITEISTFHRGINQDGYLVRWLADPAVLCDTKPEFGQSLTSIVDDLNEATDYGNKEFGQIADLRNRIAALSESRAYTDIERIKEARHWWKTIGEGMLEESRDTDMSTIWVFEEAHRLGYSWVTEKDWEDRCGELQVLIRGRAE